MTSQARERILYKGEEVGMDTEPLNQYLRTKKSVNFVSGSIACWRGYYGKWEIQSNKLYLVDLKGYITKSLENHSNLELNKKSKYGIFKK